VGIKSMVEGVNSSMIYFIYCKNFCKCHNVPPPSTTIKKRKRKKKKRCLVRLGWDWGWRQGSCLWIFSAYSVLLMSGRKAGRSREQPIHLQRHQGPCKDAVGLPGRQEPGWEKQREGEDVRVNGR
jgi:hypothetical protein